MWSIGYGNTPGDAWMNVWEEARGRGLVRQGRVGLAECSLFRVRAMLGIYEGLLRADALGLFGIH